MMEVIVTAFRQMLLLGAAVGFMVPALQDSASAQQTDLERAWHECLKLVSQARPRPDSGEEDAARTAAFKACMAAKGIRP
jgi:hypothetical protein